MMIFLKLYRLLHNIYLAGELMVNLKDDLIKIQYDQNWNRHRHLDLLFWGTPFTAVGVIGIIILQTVESNLSNLFKGVIFIILGLFGFVLAGQMSKFYKLMNQHSKFINDLEGLQELNNSPFRTQNETNRSKNNIKSFLKLRFLIEKQQNWSSRMIIIIFMNYFWIGLIIVGVYFFIIIMQEGIK